ncbi:hypothetical protein [Ferrimonas sp. YFM]|uniref:hypothetical protein n=1 Tax=Ferrimonas sp. YFM TaxID=3028878 RepID=UPI002572DABE|nr:hypothetical protein [Ferrimonas sp. YFM]
MQTVDVDQIDDHLAAVGIQAGYFRSLNLFEKVHFLLIIRGNAYLNSVFGNHLVRALMFGNLQSPVSLLLLNPARVVLGKFPIGLAVYAEFEGASLLVPLIFHIEIAARLAPPSLTNFILAIIDCIKKDIEGGKIARLKGLDKTVADRFAPMVLVEPVNYIVASNDNGLGGRRDNVQGAVVVFPFIPVKVHGLASHSVVWQSTKDVVIGA